MKKRMFVPIGCLLLRVATGAPAAEPGSAPGSLNEQLLSEQKHFVECLARVYSPAWWFSYNDSLYFQAKDEAQARQLEEMKAARANYVALTNREARYHIAAKFIAGSGVNELWQLKLLLPFSATNQNLTPTLDRPARLVPRYTVLQTLPAGDALIEDNTSTFFVMNFGRGMDDGSGTNATLIKVGVKAFLSGGRFHTIDAYMNASLNKEETAVLNRVATAFQKEAASLGQQIAGSKARQEFEDCKARASDSNPYMQYLLAKAYLEGKGTDNDEKLGLEWMRKAAQNGSGDATSYLETLGHKAP